MGDEGKIQKELLSTVSGVSGIKPPTNLYARNRAGDSYFSGAGSQNIWLMWLATRHLQEIAEPETNELIFEMYRYQLDTWYGGSEFLSSIYWPWHVMSHAALMRSKNGEIKNLATRWLSLNWALFREITGPNGAVLCYGQRSVGHKPQPSVIDWIHAVAQGDVRQERKAESWCRSARLGLRNSWEYAMGQELRKELRASYEEFKSSPISIHDLSSLLHLRVPSTIIRTIGGVVIVHSQTCNANTAPILVAKYDGEELNTLPANGGFRFRHFDEASTSIDADNRVIKYWSDTFTNREEVKMDFPSGEVMHIVPLGMG